MVRDRLGVLLVALSAAGFGTLGIFGKLAFAADLSLSTMLVVRFFLATALVWAVLWSRGSLRLLSGRPLAVALSLGAFGYAAMSGLYFASLSFLTAGLAGIVLYTYPAFVILLSAAALGERVTVRTVLSLVTALAGVVFITEADAAGADVRGIALVLGAAVVYAAYITASRAVLETVEPHTLMAHVLPAAGLAFLVYGTLSNGLSAPTNGYQWSLLLAIAVLATVVPVFAFYTGLERIGAGPTSIVSTVEPVVTVALGAAVLGEPVTTATVLGGGLVLAGVLLVRT